MKHRAMLCCVLVLFVCCALASPAAGQARPGPGNAGFRAGLSLGYLTQALGLKDEELETIPKMTSLLAGVVLGYELQPGFSLALHVGTCSSSFDSLTFRRLPYSLEVDADSGSMRGILVGLEVEKSILGGVPFGVDFRGQFIGSFGLSKEWKLSGLAVGGSAKGRPTWMKASAGPVVTYRGWSRITPFFFPRFDYLWGNFEFEETVQELTGNEKKDIKGKSRFGFGLGADFELSSSLLFRGEAGIHPRSGGMDFSLLIQTLFAF